MRTLSLVTVTLIWMTGFLAPATTLAQAQSEDRSYKVLPGDILQISVWKEEDLQLEVLVRPDGAFSFPLAGDIVTNNQSVLQLKDELTQRLARYISAPVVTVSVKEVLGNKVYVIGAVKAPGAFTVNPSVDVTQALAFAEGFTEFAKKDNIRILRRANGVQRSISFNFEDVARGRNLNQNIMLQSGDVVVVP